MTELKATFAGSIPEYYDRYLGPAWFGPFASDLAARLPAKPPGDVLEIACGTGLVTRELRDRLDPSIRLVATDLSKPMLDYARKQLGDRPGLEWREADAARLPFGDREFGAVVCQFGFMFVPDKKAAFSEARRVLEDGGRLLFNVWDRIEENRHNEVNAAVVEGLFPGDAEVRFRVPYEMHDQGLLRQLLSQAGFQETAMLIRRLPVDGVSAHDIAFGQIHGTPRSLLLQKRGIPLDDIVELVSDALAKVGGADPYRGHAQAIVVEARAA
jgi:ubiquinone/menaquinone biosynthesis C-methylase UbiE